MLSKQEHNHIRHVIIEHMADLGRMLDVHILKALFGLIDEIENEYQCQAMIAGGALRDLLTFRMPKDFDVFLIGCESHQPKLEPEPIKFIDTDQEPSDLNPDSGMSLISQKRLLSIEALSWPVEIITTDIHRFSTPESVLSGFGVDVAMLGMLGDGRIIVCDYTPPIDQYFAREYKVPNPDRFDYKYEAKMTAKGWRRIDEP